MKIPSRIAHLLCTSGLIVGAATLSIAAVFSTFVTSPNVQAQNLDVDPNYYGRFTNALPSDPSYFPIGVWFESVLSQADVNLDKDAGLNLYVVLTGNSDLSLIQRNGMRAILQESGWRNNQTAIESAAVAGWALFDEVDMQQGTNQAFDTLNDILAKLPNDHRLRYNNYGKGVMFWKTNEQAQRFVNDFQHVVSNDIYWFTDPNVSKASEGGKLLNGGRQLTPAQTRRAANYGYSVDRMRELVGGTKPVWNFVEVGWPFTETEAQGGRAIEPAEVTAAVWHGLIAGAKGIIYFNHSFGGPNQTQHCLRETAYSAVRAAVKNTKCLVSRLAPMLNAPFADGLVRPSPSVRVMTKLHEGKYYIFAGSRENVASTAMFSLSGVESGTVTVINENRTIPISSGKFSDVFQDGNAIHIYEIDSR